MLDKTKLDLIYQRYNRRKYVTPDPLQFLYNYPKSQDREIIGLIASSLAYGQVAQILQNVEIILNRIGKSPSSFLRDTSRSRMNRMFSGFRHRFTSHTDIVNLLTGITEAISRHGSLNQCFLAGFNSSDKTVLPALNQFVTELKGSRNSQSCYLLPAPEKGSACKRLNLFLRWMVRCDAVDPGGWEGIPRNKLIIPLDTHMGRLGMRLGLTKRNALDIKTGLEITQAFREVAPSDPVKYDFALTRFGIRDELKMDTLIQSLQAGKP